MTDLDGTRIVVVGSASGIGAETARLAVDRGAQVCGLDRNTGSGVDIVCDITLSDDIPVAVQRAIDRLGGLDSLIIPAGGGSYARIEATTAEVWNRTLAVNVVGPALLTAAALPALRESDNASVVTVASAAGLRTYPEFTAYASSKAALVRWTRVAAAELAGDGIRVNCVSPGPIDTPMLRDNQPAGYSSDQWLTEVAKHTLMLRAGRSSEVAEAILFMASPRASYITGVILPVDGGETA